MSRVGFVVLHYMTIDDTIHCVDSIVSNVPGAPVVVVDNGSFNKTGEQLKRYYAGVFRVTVLCLNNNLGFARGNNVGIRYIKEHFHVDFVTVMNNDTLILQSDFEANLLREYERSRFACLGPKIITKDGNTSTNPVEQIISGKKEIVILLIKRIIKLMLCLIHMDFMIHNSGEGVKIIGKYDNDRRYENVKLHGACWIFSPQFFQCFSGLNDATFLYFEEDLLYTDLMSHHLTTVYNPELVIKHLEDSATNSVTKNSRQKNIFVLKNEIRSLTVLLRIM